jgi:hypothetical protein
MLSIQIGTVQFLTSQVKKFWKSNSNSAPQCPTHYSPVGNGDILDTVVHQNIRLSSVTVSNILDSDHLPIMFHILDHVKNLSGPIGKFSRWEWFQSLVSGLISP